MALSWLDRALPGADLRPNMTANRRVQFLFGVSLECRDACPARLDKIGVPGIRATRGPLSPRPAAFTLPRITQEPTGPAPGGVRGLARRFSMSACTVSMYSKQAESALNPSAVLIPNLHVSAYGQT